MTSLPVPKKIVINGKQHHCSMFETDIIYNIPNKILRGNILPLPLSFQANCRRFLQSKIEIIKNWFNPPPTPEKLERVLFVPSNIECSEDQIKIIQTNNNLNIVVKMNGIIVEDNRIFPYISLIIPEKYISSQNNNLLKADHVEKSKTSSKDYISNEIKTKTIHNVQKKSITDSEILKDVTDVLDLEEVNILDKDVLSNNKNHISNIKEYSPFIINQRPTFKDNDDDDEDDNGEDDDEDDDDDNGEDDDDEDDEDEDDSENQDDGDETEDEEERFERLQRTLDNVREEFENLRRKHFQKRH